MTRVHVCPAIEIPEVPTAPIDGAAYVLDVAALEEAIGESPFVVVEGINAAELFAFSGAVTRGP
jgi:hypothetical protein